MGVEAGAGTRSPAEPPAISAEVVGGRVNPTVDMGDEAEVRAYAAACRGRVPGFIARHFGWRGALRLHAAALGRDLLRAPVNVMLVAPTVFCRLAALLCRWVGWSRLGRWLASRNLFIETDISRRMADLVLTELLAVDQLSPSLAPGSLARIRDLIAEYLTARHAAAEFAGGLVAIGIGIALLHAFTPSAITLGPLLAHEFAQREAIEAFWLGPSAGAVWYGWFPADAGWTRTIATTLLAMCSFALVATFAGVLTDPLLRTLGVHRRRLNRLVDTMERVALGEADATLGLPDLYVVRATDLIDLVLLTLRASR